MKLGAKLTNRFPKPSLLAIFMAVNPLDHNTGILSNKMKLL